MAKVKKTVQVLIVMLTIAGTIGYMISLQAEVQANTLGMTYSEYDAKWMGEFVSREFGDCETMEEMLEAANRYVCENFEYDYELADGPQLQYTDVKRTINTRKGICFDFAMFVKACATVFAEQKGLPAKAYIAVLTPLKAGERHAYNYVVCEEKYYYVDSTFDLSAHKKGCEVYGVFALCEMSMEEHSRQNGYRIDGLR